MNLHTVHGYNRYCGPTALSAILGISTDEAARRIRLITGRPRVRGVARLHMKKVLEDFGWTVVKFPPYTKTFVRLVDNRDHYPDGLYLINITDHYIVGRKEKNLWNIVDNQFKNEIDVLEHPDKGKRIQRLYYLVPPSAPPLIVDLSEAKAANLYKDR